MSTNAIEECLWFEELEEKYYNRYITLRIDPEYSFIVVDPYLINMQDLKNLKPGRIVRLRKPAWGRERLSESIKVFERKVKYALR